MRLCVRVDNRIRLPLKSLSENVVLDLQKEFTHSNPEVAMKRALNLPFWHIPKQIKTWRIEGDELTLPRGGMQRVREVLDRHRVARDIRDHRNEGSPCPHFPNYIGWPLRYYQENMVQAALAKENCIIRAATASGKTEAAFALLSRVGLNALVILPTSGLFEQWAERAEKALGVKGDQLGIVRGKTRRLRPLTIAMQATLARGVHEDVKEFFGVILVDECQKSPADSMARIIDTMPARYRIGVSASEKRRDRKEFISYDLFGDVALEVSRDTLTEEGHILDVEIRVVPTSFRADWYGLPTNGQDKEVDFNRLLDEMTNDVKRNALATRHALEEVERGEQVIIFTHRREHAHTLDRFFVEQSIPTGCMLGDEEPGDADEYARTCSGLKDGSVRVGVGTYNAVGVGIDLPAVSVGVASTPISANQQNFNQVRGRLCRLNPKAGKKQGRLYLLYDQAIYGMRHLKNIIAWNQSVVVFHKGKWIDAKRYMKDESARLRQTKRQELFG